MGWRPDIRRALVGSVLSLVAVACSTRGSTWVEQPVNDYEVEGDVSVDPPPADSARSVRSLEARRIGGEPEADPEFGAPDVVARRVAVAKVQGRVLGTFRNTYYDFPNERQYSGKATKLYDPQCQVIAEVAKGFHDAVCVQGSGVLQSGVTVSFAKRDCSCAAVCPRTEQRICFNALDQQEFPWGRGATGRAITPLLTVAVDTSVIPLETAIYIPEFDRLPRDPAQKTFHDGCFLAQDRGIRIQGKHVDVFTGDPAITKLWNGLVPSNRGVTVVLDSPRCARGKR